jgi:beta-glucosidase 2, glycosyl-hydrolase family 116 N-term/Glycosyl-hydrolase family 116, catalytic region
MPDLAGTAPSTGSAQDAEWPVARRYTGRDRLRISLPVGGIGTGTVGFGGRGQFRDWELENQPSKGLTSPLTFLACRVAGPGTPPQARILEGALFDEEVEGWMGSLAPLAGLPRFADCEFQAAYPFGRVVLSDPDFPVQATVAAVNPLSPGDAELSGLPLAIFRVVLTSRAEHPIEASVAFSVEVLTGHALRERGEPSRPTAEHRSAAGLAGVLLTDAAMDRDHEKWGTIAAAAVGQGAWSGPAWGIGKWNQGLFEMWEGFLATGKPAGSTFGHGENVPMSSRALAGTVGAARTLEPGGTAEVVFLLGWHFPNRRAWRQGDQGPRGLSGPEIVGNHYATTTADAWAVLTAQAPHLDEAEGVTRRFVSALWSSDLSAPVKEAALFNLSTLRSQTFFRTADGLPFGWEGCLDNAGSCLGSCTHVWNYDLATGYLFGGLARQMRELEYLHATDAAGAMSFRILLPLSKAQDFPLAAADGQFGCVVKLHRDWKLSGDDDWLRLLWPACRRSLEFAWIAGGWDADADGLCEGAQHNTMDVEYYGPNPVIQGWYLAALAAGAEMAAAVGDAEFADRCRDVLAAGQRATEATLFNGRYYQQQVIPPGNFGRIADKLRSDRMGAERPDEPEFQIGDGCILDQLVGDTYARLTGVGAVFNADHAAKALAAIHELNYVPDFGNWTNYVRTYAVHGERGHVVESYPAGLPEHPMPYWSEVWTGLEYVYALGLVQHGRADLAEDVVAAVRERFTGARRNPFDEAECGHHYARAMASWGLVVAMTGFSYDARAGVMRFARATSPVQWFWSSGSAWGVLHQSPGDQGPGSARLEVLSGSVRVDKVLIGDRVFRPKAAGLLTSASSTELEPGS